jgi:glucokinase
VAEHCIGIDLGGTAVKIGLVDSKGKIRDSIQIPTGSGRTAEAIGESIVLGVERLAKKNPKYPARAAGIGVPGFTEPSTGTITFIPNIPVLEGYPVTRRIEKALGLPVFADNDANNAARGEFLFGSAKGIRNFVFITLGTGIGGGLFLNGDLYDGYKNYAGEVGHMTVVPEGRVCGCGNYGCWEAYSSVTAMVKRAKAIIEKGNQTRLKKYYPDRLEAKVIADEARKGDFIAEHVFSEAAKYNGVGIANLINTLNPEAVIIGGGVSNAGSYLLDRIRHFTQIYTVRKSWEAVDIRLATLGNSAGIAGSAALAFMKTR